MIEYKKRTTVSNRRENQLTFEILNHRLCLKLSIPKFAMYTYAILYWNDDTKISQNASVVETLIHLKKNKKELIFRHIKLWYHPQDLNLDSLPKKYLEFLTADIQSKICEGILSFPISLLCQMSSIYLMIRWNELPTSKTIEFASQSAMLCWYVGSILSISIQMCRVI